MSNPYEDEFSKYEKEAEERANKNGKNYKLRAHLHKPVANSDMQTKDKFIIKFSKITELDDPQRKNKQVIRKDEIYDLQLDLYLFGKGANINA